MHLRVSEVYDCLPIDVGQSDVEPPALDYDSHESIFLSQPVQAGSQLKLPALADVVVDVFFEDFDEPRLEHVLPEDGEKMPVFDPVHGQVRLRVFQAALLRKFRNGEGGVLRLPDPRHAPEVADLRAAGDLQPHNALPEVLICIQDLPRAGRLRGGGVGVWLRSNLRAGRRCDARFHCEHCPEYRCPVVAHRAAAHSGCTQYRPRPRRLVFGVGHLTPRIPRSVSRA